MKEEGIKARRFAATFRDGVSKGENRDSPLWLLVRIHFAPTLKFLKFKNRQRSHSDNDPFLRCRL
jgi:hypothetical protein